MRQSSGLYRRWIRTTMTVVIPLAVVCILAVTASFAMYYYSDMESDLNYRAEVSSEFFSGYMNVDYNQYYESCATYAETFDDRNRIELQFINRHGKLVASSYGPWAGKSPETREIADALRSRETRTFVGRDRHTGERVMAVSSPVLYSNGEIIGVLRFVTSTEKMDLQIVKMAGISMLFCVFFMIIALISANYYIRSILIPVDEIIKTAQRIAGGSYGAQIKTRYDDEIGVLADTINEMSKQINQNEKMQTDFISSLSHELRTPLTAITGWGETLLSGDELDAEDAKRGMGIIVKEARRLTEMVEGLLEFTRIQDGRMTLNMEQTDIRSEFEDTVFMYGSKLRMDGIDLQYRDSDEEIPEISCDPQRMRQVFLNILDNAAKHGGSGAVIEASIACDESDVILKIRDHGPGIPEDELPLVKKKFYKGSSKVRGSGIGLAVCDEIVAMHGGSLELENAIGGGALITIRLPLNQ